MPEITFLPSSIVIDAPPGTELLEAARRAGVEIDTPCGAKGTCGRCIVRVVDGDVESDSLGVLPNTAVVEGYVLACKTRVQDSPITVETPEIAARSGGQFGDGDETYLVRRELLPTKWEYGPLAVKWLLQVASPQPEDGMSDIDRLTRAIQRQWGKLEVVYPIRIIRETADVLRASEGQATVTLVLDEWKLNVIRIEPGDQTTRHYAIAVDVGTTTVAVQLINLTVAQIVATQSAYNDQVACGLDVISRIDYAGRPGGLEGLRTRVLETINRLLTELVRNRGIALEEITNAVVSANTTMTHLLLGLKPDFIRLAPYTPTVLETPYVTADEVGLNINPDSWICFSPSIGSYVGGDITAGLLCTDIAAGTDELCLFIDIGTNGELVIGNNDFLISCACSAGPAFEGGGIGCGMRAAIGAIERVEVDAETGACEYWTIGNAPPRGICGSGMIAVIANLFTAGWLDPAGKLDTTRHSPNIEVKGKQARYIIAPADRSATGEPVAISEMDIENIIRAKAAIFSACAVLLKQVGVGIEDLARIYVAGGFGRYLDLEKAITLGLIPDIERHRFQFIGNASLMGSYMVVVSQDYRQRQLDLARRMTYVDLSNYPGYMEEYMGAMFLPHTHAELFPTVSAQLAER
ncbi:MAG: DUF4445 domain-containing protein [Candidatus Hydrogenedentes bacterium]|nr:DUF4445 domain-containing protein [Candidatus Hydrogenedentota bacterium]